ncbi:MAG: Na+/H+ antiporter subunit E [Candidatus Margulisiibacteriota bacterium]|nr:Na+/H+ antiporter subunit E [Candidatus Margulisiibacteriota bacterium]
MTFIILFIFWILWSGKFDPFHLIFGIISVFIVVKWSGSLFVTQKKPLSQRIKEWIRFEVYSFWLLWQIVIANLEVFKLAFHPNVLDQINPKFITFKSPVKGDVAQFIFAQSITLTPGTVTLSIIDGIFKVHAINSSAAAELPGDMQDKILNIYKEDHNG